MFNSNFYPTPERLITELLSLGRGIGNRVLEPSAGKGNIIDYLLARKGRYKEMKVDAIEKDVELRNFLFGAGHHVVWDDFLTFETHKEYSDIIMNPPFDEGAKHVLKAIELSERQISTSCTIYAIINAETIKNPYSIERKLLIEALEKYDAKIEYKANAFIDSERKTNVEVALIYLTIDTSVKGEDLYSSLVKGFVKKDTSVIERGLSTQVDSQELRERLDDIERYVNEYDQAVKLMKASYAAMHDRVRFIHYLDSINKFDSKVFGINKTEYSNTQLDQELQALRSTYWQLILNTKRIRSILTEGGIKKLEKQIALAETMEINMVNIELLILSLQHNQNDLLIDSCVALFERITKYHMNDYSKNIHYYNGWRTNNAFKVNPKVILPTYIDSYWLTSSFEKETFNKLDYNVQSLINDIVRMMQLFNPAITNEFETSGSNDFENDWLRFKIFKKGTIHIWFKDKDTLTKFNYVCGKHFNWLPTDDEMETEEAITFVMKEFGELVDTDNLLSFQ